MQQPLRALLEESTQIVNYISYISYMLIVCFVLTIINNSLLIFDEIRPTCKNSKCWEQPKRSYKNVILRNMYIMSAVLIGGLLIIYILVPNIIYLGVNLGVYLLTYQPVDFIKSAVIFIVFYLIGNFTYLKE